MRRDVILRLLLRSGGIRGAAAAEYTLPQCSGVLLASCQGHALQPTALSPAWQPSPGHAPASTGWPSLSFAASYAKGKGAKQKGGAPKGKAEAEEAEAAPEFDMQQVERSMSQAVQHLTTEMSKIRTGRANPGILEPIMVDAQHDRTQLRNLGTVTQRNPHLLVVTTFSADDMEAVAKAIRESPLQLGARVEGKEVHVPVPRPTVEVLQRMSKLVHQEAEAAKAAVRHARHQGIEGVKKAMKDLPDDRYRLEKEVQKLCDRYVAEVEKLKQQKDKDLKDNH